MEYKNTILLIIMAIAIASVAGQVYPYRYESGFKLFQSDMDISGRSIINGSVVDMHTVTNVSQNYTANLTEDTILVDATKGSVNLSLPGAANATGKVYTFKKVDVSAGNMTVQSAMMFLGNESNYTVPTGTWQANIFNQTYFYSINITSGSFVLSDIHIHVNQTTGFFNASIYNDTGNGKPYRKLDETNNVSIATALMSGSWAKATFTNGTVALQPGQKYWIGLRLNNTAAYVNNATWANVTVWNLTNNNSVGMMPDYANQTILNQTGEYRLLVPHIAFNMAEIETDATMTKGTATRYGTFRIQSDGVRWWVI